MKLAVLFAVCLIPAAAQDLPAGPGQETVKKVCGNCHDFTAIVERHYSRDRWSSVVDDMVSKGAQGTDQELEDVVNYLADHFGLQKINVNKAVAADLVKTLGITQDSAAAIVQYRAKNSIKSLDELKSIPGVDGKVIDAKKDLIEF